ncbi:hypothetical protein DFA_05392 [Cavenderia fasciculata]|uniref:Uncharacterized protein n=1 Tax=Cavenderia fasciculata TaxID=261658 RepID=F4PL38_CACFS|nr:uncharacterized protein DFA_05392 [Cavenderia fasciculata]EGG23260.1 hypothetical protein DFA_05392 [Cavenderia fasciculata]|eukprot:XP_004361111.1 hypothetical protein DFA_05392 [Cavenderia fasciculata]
MYNLFKSSGGQSLMRSLINQSNLIKSSTTSTTSTSTSTSIRSYSIDSNNTIKPPPSSFKYNNNNNNNNSNNNNNQSKPKKMVPEWKEKQRIERKKSQRVHRESTEGRHSRQIDNNIHYLLDFSSFETIIHLKSHPIADLLKGDDVENQIGLYVRHVIDRGTLEKDLSKLVRSRFDGIPEESIRVYLQYLEDFMMSRRSELDWTEGLACNLVQAHLIRGHLELAENLFDRFRSVSSFHCILMYHVRNKRPLLALEYLDQKMTVIPTYGTSNLCSQFISEMMGPYLKTWSNNLYLKNVTSMALEYQKDLEEAHYRDMNNEISGGGAVDHFVMELNASRSRGPETIAALVIYNQLDHQPHHCLLPADGPLRDGAQVVRPPSRLWPDARPLFNLLFPPLPPGTRPRGIGARQVLEQLAL